MKTVNIHAAKTNSPSLKARKPKARLVPLGKKDLGSTLGALKGKIRISDDFDEALPPEMLKAFGIEE